MNNIEKEKLYNEIKHRIVAGVHPESIYVFGSFAKNMEKEDSDIDLLVEMDTQIPMIKRFGSVRRLLREIPYPFDILVYTPDELKERLRDKYSVACQAITEGEKIYGK